MKKNLKKIVKLIIILLCICIYKEVLAIDNEEDIEIHVDQIELNNSVLYMVPENVNETQSYYKKKLVATLTPSNASNKEVTWTSSDTTVATVDSNGVIIAKSPGSSIITVKTNDGGKIANCTVNVVSNVLSNVYEINPTEICRVPRDNSNDIRPMQGVYFYKSNDTEYAIYAGYQADDKPTVMTLVNLNTGTVISKNNSKCMIHANDIAYVDGKYYVTLDTSVYGMTIKDNQEIIIDDEPIEMNFAVAGFEYDKENNKYYTRKGEYLYTVPSLESDKNDHKEIGVFPNYYSNIEEGNTKIVNQGLYYANNNIYIPRTISDSTSIYYNHSYICVFDATTGVYKYTMHFSDNFLGHLEGITIIDNTMYFGMNFHNTTPRTQTFLKYEGIDEIEQKYQLSMDKEKPEYEVNYSTTLSTNEDVTVTITANEEIQGVEGWTLSEDKKVLTKTYIENTEEEVIIKDLVGNSTSKTIIKISNIDKIAPKIDVAYSTTSVTDKDVIVTITSDKIIKSIDGWTLSSDKKQLTKNFKENGEEQITITDEAGNSVTINIKVSNIDKNITEEPERIVPSSTDEAEDSDITNIKVSNIDKGITEETESIMPLSYDATISEKILPNTGEKNILIYIAIFVVVSTVMYIKLKKYKDVK